MSRSSSTIREHDEGDMLILNEGTDVLMHRAIGGDGSDGLDKDVVDVLLIAFESGEDVVVGVGGSKGGVGAMDDEHGGGTCDELDEVVGVDEDWGAFDGMREIKEEDECRDVASVMYAS
ncbi:hypothetical protein COCNU_scaffold013488G000010 [Cocos nucifera]|nr:hypothetical protein [Cocos nucifera]